MKHGLSRSVEYKTWHGMRGRCSNPNWTGYEHYGGRGITVCERWSHFENFFADMGPRPEGHYSIERKDVNGNYEPANCIWLLNSLQSNNRRNTTRLIFEGRTHSVKECSAITGLNTATIFARIYAGYTPEACLSAERPTRDVFANPEIKLKMMRHIHIPIKKPVHAKLKAEAAQRGITLRAHINSVLRRHALGSGK